MRKTLTRMYLETSLPGGPCALDVNTIADVATGATVVTGNESVLSLERWGILQSRSDASESVRECIAQWLQSVIDSMTAGEVANPIGLGS